MAQHPISETILPAEHSIALDNGWTLRITDTGQVIGTGGEGLFGYIAVLHGAHRAGGQSQLALKLPRLIADTLEENSYVADVLRDERDIVTELWSTPNLPRTGLLGTGMTTLPALAEAQLVSMGDSDDAQTGRAAIFLSFDRRGHPRVCRVVRSAKDEKMSFTPATLEAELLPVLNAIWTNAYQQSSRFRKLGYFRPCTDEEAAAPTSKANLFGLLKAPATQLQSEKVWYWGVPCVAYEWANGTLEQIATKGQLRRWSQKQLIDLFTMVLTGVESLHNFGFRHGDIRPSNIMFIGDGSRPDQFRLGDYGSFAENKEHGEGNPGGRGQTTVTRIGGMRLSPFYAPERSSGIEREAANVAIVHAPPNQNYYVLRLGWRTDLADSDKRAIPERLSELSQWHEAWKANSRPPSAGDSVSTALLKGDRIRVGNKVFHIVHAELGSPENGQPWLMTCVCEKRYALVLHERLSVYDQSPKLEDGEAITLPNFFEFRQWSAATDLYGIGALCLYCLLYSVPHESVDAEASQPVEAKLHQVDESFAEMMKVLASPLYGREFWKHLEKFRRVADALYEGGKSDSDKALQFNVDGETLYQIAETAAYNIVQSAPAVRDILQRFDWNLARFIFVMHFVLSCLHRRDDLKLEQSDGPFPFSRSRADDPSSGSAKAALSRLERLEAYLNPGIFDKFISVPTKVPKFTPRSDYGIGQDNTTLRTEKEALKVRIEGAETDRTALRNEKEALLLRLNKADTDRQKCDERISAALNALAEPTNVFGVVGSDVIKRVRGILSVTDV